MNQHLQYLKDHGVTTAVVSFSGGNDEGGVDEIAFFGPDGQPVELNLPDAYIQEQREWVDGKWVSTPNMVATWSPGEKTRWRPATPEEMHAHALRRFLGEPVYERYGSFAGEYSVHGRVTWEVASGKHAMTGQESYTEWADL